VGLLPVNMRARLFPKFMAWLFEPWACRIMKMIRAPKIRIGRNCTSSPSQLPNWLGSFTFTCTPSAPPTFTPSSFSNLTTSVLLWIRDL